MKLNEYRQKRSLALDAMEALTEKCISDEREFTDDEQVQFDTLKTEELRLSNQIKALEEIHQRKLASATPVQPVISERKEAAQPKTPKTKHADLACTLRCLWESRGNTLNAARIASEKWGNEAVANQLARGEKALNYSSGPDGGYLVPDQYSNEFIDALRASTVVYEAGARVVPMPSGSLSFSAGTSDGSAYYVGEGSRITASQPQFAKITMNAKKLASLCAISNDLLRYASPQSDAFIVDRLVKRTALRADLAMIRGDGLNHTPRGLRSWAGNVNAQTATPDAAKIESDIVSKLLGKLAGSNVSLDRCAIFMSPRVALHLQYLREAGGGNRVFPEMERGLLAGARYFTTNQIPNNLGGGTESEVIMANMDHVMIGESGSLQIDVSADAAYHDGSSVVPAFSHDESVIRVVVSHDLCVTHQEAVAVVSGVTWGA